MTTKIPIELSSTPGIVDSSNTTALTLDASQNAIFAGTVTGSRKLVLDASGTNDTHIEIGANTASNHYAFIDLVGDATYTDYGLRIIRNNGGANTSSFIYHRGTGNFNIETQDSASLKLRTAGADALTIDTSQNATFAGTISSGAITSSGNITANGGTLTASSTGGATLTLEDSGSHLFRIVTENNVNSLNFKEGGNNTIMSLEGSNRRVGIGTTSPAKSLSVKAPSGSNGGIDVFHNNGNKVAELVHHGSGDEGRLSLYDGGTSTVQLHGETGQNSYINSGKVIIGDTTSHVDDLLQIESPASGGGHGIQIRRNDSNGDQGIGRIMFGNNNDTDLATISSITDGQADCARLVFSTQPTSGNSTERMRISSSGSVGIGTSPATHYTGYEALDIGNVLSLFSNNSGTNVSTLTNNGYLNSSASQWTYKVTDEATMYSQVHGDHRFSTAASGSAGSAISWSEKMRISNSGQVGIGTTSFSNGRLDVRSDVANTTEVIGVKNDNSGSYNVMMKFFRQSSAVGRIDWDNTGSSMGFVNLSDERLKTVTGIAKGLSFINRLEPKTYNFKDNDWETEGLIAQEVKAAMEAEEIVVRGIREPETEDDYYGLDYGTFVPNLIQAIKELSAKNDALEARIQELEG